MSARPVIRRGSAGQAVAVWQRAIGVSTDGVFGRQTEAATKAWQSRHNLEPDGIVGPATWATVVSPDAPTEKRVPTVRTSLSVGDFAIGVLRAWPEVEKAQAGVLWSHFAVECGDGRSCWNYNLGNVKHVAGDGHDFVALHGVWEGATVSEAARLVAAGHWREDADASHQKAVGPGKVAIAATDDNPATWFRAYETLDEGMRAFLNLKKNPESRYHAAWAFVLDGDATAYARTLGRLGYYTASPDIYAANMSAKWSAWMGAETFETIADALASRAG